jgi:peptide/nickel transport system permease protein
VGTILGALAGASRGLGDVVLMRVVDAALVCPPILLALAIVGAIGPGLVPAAVALAAVEAPVFARLTRGAMVVAREAPAVEAAIALGAGRWRVAVRHVLPAALGLVVVQAASSTAFAVAALAGLSFLGLGVQPPTPDWGDMLARSRTTAVSAPWLVAAPAAALVLTVLACHLLGDALHDALVRRGRRWG